MRKLLKAASCFLLLAALLAAGHAGASLSLPQFNSNIASSGPPPDTIAFVAAADLGNNGGVGSLTTSYTVGSGTDRLLVVCLAGDIIGGADDISSVTYNGVAMTLAVKDATDGSGGQNRILYQYYLPAPASGAHNVVVSSTSNHFLLAVAADYSGVRQSGPVNGTNTAFESATHFVTVATTTTVNNSWAINCSPDQAAATAPAASTGATFRIGEGAFNVFGLFDSGAAITPAGSYSMITQWTASAGSPSLIAIAAGYAPGP